MAILIPQKPFTFFRQAPTKKNSDVMEAHLTVQNISDNEPMIFRFYSCWSMTDENFISKDYFRKFLYEEAMKFDESVIVKMGKMKMV